MNRHLHPFALSFDKHVLSPALRGIILREPQDERRAEGLTMMGPNPTVLSLSKDKLRTNGFDTQ